MTNTEKAQKKNGTTTNGIVRNNMKQNEEAQRAMQVIFIHV